MFSIITSQDFSQAKLYEQLCTCRDGLSAGAVVTFTGLVRDFNDTGAITGIELEYYPEMTQKHLDRLIHNACDRFSLIDAGVVHRVGKLNNFEQIVWVGCVALHRQAAFDAACFIMDTLKQSIPLWKKELSEQGEQWVSAKTTDYVAAKRWESNE